ncbi:MAG: VCBS repeat-containing protein [Chloroflexota bacterium]
MALKAVALVGLVLTAFSVVLAQGEPISPQLPDDGRVEPKWTISLPSAKCEAESLGTDCHRSSPAIADINGDNQPDIIVATNSGHILAVSGSGSVLWDRDIAPYFGLSSNQQTITSSPAIGDIDADGSPEIVVGTGYEASDCKPGGVIALRNDGSLMSGWPVSTRDNNIAPSNCPDPVFSTPALGDLDNDGDLEIVAGSFDNRIYAWHHDGRLLDGFPGKSILYDMLGWPNMRDQLADTIWSSPALGDLDGDGYLDIVIGTDEGMVDGTFGNPDWDCPYESPSGAPDGYCGGALYAYDHEGEFLPGYPKHILEVIQSSPALIDANRDGHADVFVGTGSYYRNYSPDRPTYGMRMFGWSHNGNDLPGWGGGQPTLSVLPASPAVGDIAGDAAPEIIIPGIGGRIYAWHQDGSVVSGFPAAAPNYMGSTGSQDVGKSPVLGDYDGDGKMEIFLTVGWSVTIIDGNGRILTNTNAPSDGSTPFYVANGLLQNNPALGDIDGDGVLELIVQNSDLIVWDLPSGATAATWPMFRHDAGAPEPSSRIISRSSRQKLNWRTGWRTTGSGSGDRDSRGWVFI